MKLSLGYPSFTRAPTTANTTIQGSVHLSIVEIIGSKIVRGEFPVGSVLPNEAKWALDFGVSRSAVREAIKILMAKGLLTSRPKVGSRVAPRDAWNLLDHDVLAWYIHSSDRKSVLQTLQQFRKIFEPEAAALAAQFRSEQQLEAIELARKEMAEAPNVSERAAADVRFHLAILKASGNELLYPLGILIVSALQSLFLLITTGSGMVHYAQDLHDDIAIAIKKKNSNKARLAVQKLLADSDRMIRKLTSR